MRGFDVQGSIFKDGIRDLTNTAKILLIRNS